MGPIRTGLDWISPGPQQVFFENIVTMLFAQDLETFAQGGGPHNKELGSRRQEHDTPLAACVKMNHGEGLSYAIQLRGRSPDFCGRSSKNSLCRRRLPSCHSGVASLMSKGVVGIQEIMKWVLKPETRVILVRSSTIYRTDMIFGVSVSEQTAKRCRSHNSSRAGSAPISGRARGNPVSRLALEIPPAACFCRPLNRQKPALPTSGLART